MGSFKVLTTSFSKFRTLGSSYSWSCPPCYVPAFFGAPTPTSTVTSSLDSSSWYTSTAQSGPSGPLLQMKHSHPTLVFKPLIFFHPLCIFSLCIFTTTSCSWLFLFTSCFFLPFLTPSGFFNGGVSKPGALNFYTLFCLISLTLFVSRNQTLIYCPLSGSLDPLLCDLIAATHSLVFFLLMSQTLAAASSFSSDRDYPSLSFLPPLFLGLTPTLLM